MAAVALSAEAAKRISMKPSTWREGSLTVAAIAMWAWKSIGSFIVAGDRLLLANDPNCIDTVGLYTWRIEGGLLFLEAIDDPCAIKLRGLNLTQQPWQACLPPSFAAGVTEHGSQPEGCD